jgi:hypothetical protein
MGLPGRRRGRLLGLSPQLGPSAAEKDRERRGPWLRMTRTRSELRADQAAAAGLAPPRLPGFVSGAGLIPIDLLVLCRRLREHDLRHLDPAGANHDLARPPWPAPFFPILSVVENLGNFKDDLRSHSGEKRQDHPTRRARHHPGRPMKPRRRLVSSDHVPRGQGRRGRCRPPRRQCRLRGPGSAIRPRTRQRPEGERPAADRSADGAGAE